MKFSLIPDIHIDKHEKTIQTKIDLLKTYFKNSTDNFILSGDIFDGRNKISPFAICELQKIFENSRKHIYIIVGNHDSKFVNTIFPNSIEASFKNIDNVHIIDKPIEIDNFLLVPWICEINKDEIIKAIRETDKKYLCGHFEINEFYMASGVKCQTGFKISEFDKFEKVFSGHYHIRQEYKNILYLGSLIQESWSDYDNSKGYYIIDTETNELEFIEGHIQKYHHIILNSNDDEINLDKYINSNVKLWYHNKLSKKQFEQIEELKNTVESYQIFDESVKLNETVIENVEFKQMLDEFMVDQDFEDKFKCDIKQYMNLKYEEIG